MRKTYRFRAYPTKSQDKLIENHFDRSRFLYNKLLETNKKSYEETGKSVLGYDLLKTIPIIKNEYSFLKDTYSQVFQDVGKRVDLAYKHFFRRVKSGEKPGYPRFKGKHRYSSITYPQNNGSFSIENDAVTISKIGRVKICKHREVVGDIKTLTIKKTSSGKYYILISCDNIPVVKVKTNIDRVVGIDLGIKTFAYLSDKTKIENPRFLKKEEKELTKACRALSRQPKGTSLRAKARRKLCKIYERITNKRDNFSHQESRKLIDNYDLVILEDLKIDKMLQDGFRNLNKNICDVSWSDFVNKCIYKAEEAGKHIIKVPPENTTQKCSNCNKIVKKSLRDRVHKCECGSNLDRDLNAAINIFNLGLAKAKQKGMGIHSLAEMPRSPRL